MGRKSIAEIRRKEMLEAFYDLIVDEGMEKASVAKLAKRMGVNASLVIHYFQTKDALVGALIEYMLNRYEQKFLPLLHSQDTPEQRLQWVFSALFSKEWDEAQGSIFYTCLPLIFRNESVRLQYQHLFQRFKRYAVDELAQARDAGMIQVKNLELAADLLITCLEGFNVYERIRQDEAAFEEMSQTLQSVLLNAFQTGLV
ncbi:TetR/AcrR family transcriptional regulator [Pontibacter sp. G13]|uniref:TetR/AcrR family transcriptional regulator n=1 Tax=Pontibacter sp. G13 TaxID=3074898 RepID=UPI002889BBEF|nr:TetR/AcrR family transcriptional regulator [Pontibacter sp. G13]WNJ16693.1 TetR/AcrR family transcriptional regulator [Pontibacter sp. G13]